MGKYLGFPIVSKKPTKSDLEFIINKAKQKLSGWKAKLLSPAGRLTLIKSTLCALPMHVMQCTSLPVSICTSLDKLIRDFLWLDEPDKRKLHLMGWDTICLPKEQGGLGIRKCNKLNQASILKLIRRFFTLPHSPWVNLLQAKYSFQRSTNPSSHIWKAMTKNYPSFLEGISWNINKGTQVNFLQDHWLPFGPIDKNIHGPFSVEHSSFTVADTIAFLSTFGELHCHLPPSLEYIVLSHLALANPLEEDCVSWKFTLHGSFTLSSAYHMVCNFESQNREVSWKWIWKCPIIPKINFFIWLLAHDRIPFRSLLASCGIQVPTACPRCNSAPETALHLIRDCPVIINFWKSISIPSAFHGSFQLNLFSWLKANCTSKLWVTHPRIPWATYFCYLVWNLWHDRNNLCFHNYSNLQEIASKSIGLTAEFCSSNPHLRRITSCTYLPIRWLPPREGWFKLNTDGSSNFTQTCSGAGGIIRNHEGTWVMGFAQNLGYGTNNDAELWGIKISLELAAKLKIKLLEVETDSTFVVNTLADCSVKCLNHRTLIASCRLLTQQFEQVLIKHTYREANGVADTLAKHGALMEAPFVTFDSTPSFCSSSYSHDRNGCIVYRTTFCKT
ncbi:hypothetical protein SLE2022_154720 [Rubroshorea leprosula]